METRIKPHEVPMIPGCIRTLLNSVMEQMTEPGPDWEWVIANLKEAHDIALVGYQYAQTPEVSK